MAEGRLPLPNHPRSHSYGYPSTRSHAANTSPTGTYEGYIFIPSEFRDDDVDSQDRWRRARRVRSSPTEKDLQNELDTQKRNKGTAEQDLYGISAAKRDQILRLIHEQESGNPGFSFHLVALRLERGEFNQDSFIHSHSQRQKDPKTRKKSTIFMHVVLRRKPATRQVLTPANGPNTSVRGLLGNVGGVDRQSENALPRTLSGSHINTSRPQYLPTYLQQAPEWPNEHTSGPKSSNAQTPGSQQLQARPPIPIQCRNESYNKKPIYSTPSSSSSSLDSGESATTDRTRTTHYRVIERNPTSHYSAYGHVQPLVEKAATSNFLAFGSTPKAYTFAQTTPNQASYQELYSNRPQSEYPFPSIPPRLYASSSTQTDNDITASNQIDTCYADKNTREGRGSTARYSNGNHVDKPLPNNLPHGEKDVTMEENPADVRNQTQLLPDEASDVPVTEQKPAWMNNLVPGQLEILTSTGRQSL